MENVQIVINLNKQRYESTPNTILFKYFTYYHIVITEYLINVTELDEDIKFDAISALDVLDNLKSLTNFKYVIYGNNILEALHNCIDYIKIIDTMFIDSAIACKNYILYTDNLHFSQPDYIQPDYIKCNKIQGKYKLIVNKKVKCLFFQYLYILPRNLNIKEVCYNTYHTSLSSSGDNVSVVGDVDTVDTVNTVNIVDETPDSIEICDSISGKPIPTNKIYMTYNNIIYLNLSNMQIKSLNGMEELLFNKTPLSINLSNNQITDISILNKIVKNINIDLSYNGIIDLNIRMIYLTSESKLNLNLSHNNISKIKPIRLIDLYDDSVSVMSSKSGKSSMSVMNIISIDLSFNSIKSDNFNVFDTDSCNLNVLNLNLSNNELYGHLNLDLPDNITLNLNLSNNRIVSFKLLKLLLIRASINLSNNLINNIQTIQNLLTNNMEYLELIANNNPIIKSKSIMNFKCNVKSLQLNLSNCMLTGTINFKSALGAYTKTAFHTLTLSNNYIEDIKVELECTILILNLENNQMCYAPTFINSNIKILRIDLKSNNITLESIKDYNPNSSYTTNIDKIVMNLENNPISNYFYQHAYLNTENIIYIP